MTVSGAADTSNNKHGSAISVQRRTKSLSKAYELLPAAVGLLRINVRGPTNYVGHCAVPIL